MTEATCRACAGGWPSPAQRVAELCAITGGGAFVLTTSHKTLQALARLLPLRLGGKRLLVQGARPKAALTQLRNQRDISLNLEKRRAERDDLDAERLKRENARRAARGLEPVPDVAALDKLELPDAVLDEAVEIAADAAQLPKVQAPARLS